MSRSDWSLLHGLQIDGRASYADLARTTGLPQPVVTRRVTRLLSSGIAVLDVDIAPHILENKVAAQIWMSATPDRLEASGRALAAFPEVAFAAAVSGTRNLVVFIECARHEDIFRFITTELARIDGIRDIEVVPTIAVLKRATSRIDRGDVLIP
ncbi:hypothetical protein AX769_17545 [Frondihabitans sp. PAMC 28766]|uniref:Lrp/AsnC family transcriptional regulator n=1 Tax=Frondihabitans sp. PAMC 28766 TaxID=1795630 RepID=UPI00078BA3BB|nr:Lrp/AsnC family transcriptional regulator [Frondihabitans sp. PAMC 28766]AMM21615.1 hypothetical protein AX769_17545 [Frondihabitans sp. PAMC 28766]